MKQKIIKRNQIKMSERKEEIVHECSNTIRELS